MSPADFGVTATPAAAASTSSPATAFGQPSTMGGVPGSSPSPFGRSPGGFGQPSQLGGGTAFAHSPGAGHTFGETTSIRQAIGSILACRWIGIRKTNRVKFDSGIDLESTRRL